MHLYPPICLPYASIHGGKKCYRGLVSPCALLPEFSWTRIISVYDLKTSICSYPDETFVAYVHPAVRFPHWLKPFTPPSLAGLLLSFTTSPTSSESTSVACRVLGPLPPHIVSKVQVSQMGLVLKSTFSASLLI